MIIGFIRCLETCKDFFFFLGNLVICHDLCFFEDNSMNLLLNLVIMYRLLFVRI